MRVAILSKTYVAETAQRQLEWLAAQPGVEVTLLTPPAWRSDDGRWLPFLPRYTTGYNVRMVPIAFNGQYHLYLYRGLGSALGAERPDVLHIDEEPYNPAAFQAQWLGHRMGIPTVFIAWQNIQRAYPLPFAWLERYDYRHAARMIAGTATAAEVVRRKGYRGHLSVFSVHGVDPTVYTPRSGPRREEPFVVGYLGRLVAEKGVDLLIAALERLPASCHARIIGSGPMRARLRQLVHSAGLDERVELLPPIAVDEVPRMLVDLDVLVVPSRTRPNWKEQFGRILIEAMACGLPVVGANSGEIPRVLGDAGLVVPEDDVPALAAALLTLAEQPELRAALAARGRQRVLEHYTQERVAERLAEVYAGVLA
jgi:glycosyltransferase involved in cell wall biosynthesis